MEKNIRNMSYEELLDIQKELEYEKKELSKKKEEKETIIFETNNTINDLLAKQNTYRHDICELIYKIFDDITEFYDKKILKSLYLNKKLKENKKNVLGYKGLILDEVDRLFEEEDMEKLKELPILSTIKDYLINDGTFKTYGYDIEIDCIIAFSLKVLDAINKKKYSITHYEQEIGDIDKQIERIDLLRFAIKLRIVREFGDKNENLDLHSKMNNQQALDQLLNRLNGDNNVSQSCDDYEETYDELVSRI